MNVAGDWTGGLQKPNGLNRPHRRATEGAMVNTHDQQIAYVKSALEASVRTVATGSQSLVVSSIGWVHPPWVRGHRVPRRWIVSAARGKADHLPHQGSDLRTWEPRSSARPAKPGKPTSPATSRARGRVLVVVGALGQAMYVASELDRAWLQNEQRKLYARSNEQPDYVFQKLWGQVTDLRNLRNAVARVARNCGHRTAGVDGLTVRKVLAHGVDVFVDQLRHELRSGSYRPRPVRRVLIPKAGQPREHRALGIPIVKDRVVLPCTFPPLLRVDIYGEPDA